MKKNVIIFGLIGGLIASLFMVLSMAKCYNTDDFDGSMLLGFGSMIVAFSLIFVAVKNYRDKYNNGVVSFKKAFLLGLYIALIASTVYVAVWLVDYYLFIPDFMDRYAAHMRLKAIENGASQQELAKLSKEMAHNRDLYKNPVMVILFTYMEILPIGIVIALLAALILKRRNRHNEMQASEA